MTISIESEFANLPKLLFKVNVASNQTNLIVKEMQVQLWALDLRYHTRDITPQALDIGSSLDHTQSGRESPILNSSHRVFGYSKYTSQQLLQIFGYLLNWNCVWNVYKPGK